jgi:hypothetical protein
VCFGFDNDKHVLDHEFINTNMPGDINFRKSTLRYLITYSGEPCYGNPNGINVLLCLPRILSTFLSLKLANSSYG